MLEIEMEEVKAAEKVPGNPSFTTSLTKEELEQVLGQILEQMWVGQNIPRPDPMMPE